MTAEAKAILVVEDEKPLNHALTLKLTNAGYRVDSAFDGEQALSLFDVNRYDFIFLDLIMPKVDGFTVLQKLQKKGDVPPIYVLSNLGQPEDQQRAEQLGASGVLVKADTPLSDIVNLANTKLRPV